MLQNRTDSEVMNKKKPLKYTPLGNAVTGVILATFRANGRLISVGDEIGRDFGLTSNRWQVLGGIIDRPKTVAQIARNFEQTRQGVLWVVQALETSGLVEFIANPDHRTAKLVRLTQEGKEVYSKISERQIEWVNSFSKKFDLEEVETAEKVLKQLWEILGRK
jgi:DNA-binding MarR family transcriptional regulator